MYRSDVLVMDAVMAIALVESSMQGAALLLPANVDTLHAPFPENPTQNYVELVTAVLGKLKLQDLLDSELKNLHTFNTGITQNKNSVLKEPEEKIESNKDDTIESNKNDGILEVNKSNEYLSTSKIATNTVVDVTLSQIRTMNNIPKDIEQDNEPKYEIVEIIEKPRKADISSKRKSEPTTPKKANKKSKTTNSSGKKKSKNTEINDLNLLKLIPSVNDIYRLDDNLDDFNESLITNDENKVEPMAPTQERKRKKIRNVMEQFAFKATKKSPTCDKTENVLQKIKEYNKKSDNDKSVIKKVEKHNGSMEFNNENAYDMNNVSSETIKSCKVVNDNMFKVNKEIVSEKISGNSDTDSQSQLSQLSAKTLFQNDDEIDDLDFDL